MSKKESLAAFLEKLKEKKQAESLRKQAHHAVSLFYEMGHLSGRKTRNGNGKGYPGGRYYFMFYPQFGAKYMIEQ